MIANLINVSHNSDNNKGTKLFFETISLPAGTATGNIIKKSYPDSKFIIAGIENNSSIGNDISNVWQIHFNENEVRFAKIATQQFSAVGKVLVVY